MDLAGFGYSRNLPIDDITDEERAIIQSMIEEDERQQLMRTMGISTELTPDLTPSRVVEVTSRSTFHPDFSDSTPSPPSPVEDRRLRTIDVAGFSGPNPNSLKLNDAELISEKLKKLSIERESDQRVLIQSRSVIDQVSDDVNIEETEPYHQTGFRFPLKRQPSYYKAPPETINPLLLLADGPSSPRSCQTIVRTPSNDKTCYGCICDVEYDQLKTKNSIPFCLQQIGETLRISGTLVLNYSLFDLRAESILHQHDTCKVRLPLGEILSQSDKKSYSINKRFLNHPFIAVGSTAGDAKQFIAVVNRDKIEHTYVLTFYSSILYFGRKIPLNYIEMIGSLELTSIINIDITVQLSLDSIDKL